MKHTKVWTSFRPLIALCTLSLIVLLIASCSSNKRDNQSFSQNNESIKENNALMATFYNYYAEEYEALCYQAFNIARFRADEILLNKPANSKLAIIVDIDETVLDNSPHQALMVVADSSYPYMWKEWCNMAKARPVPGAIEFLTYADKMGFGIFYVSNRKKYNVEEMTVRNLDSLGFPQVNMPNILLREKKTDLNPDPSNKEKRRNTIRDQGYEIVLLIGDNLGDFFVDNTNRVKRKELLEKHKKDYGDMFIVLPNAMYGNWTASTGIKNEQSIDSLLSIMTEIFNNQ